jgi:hypothetical protein
MYEGRILGSNIGCISSYTLEVLIVHILINYGKEVLTPLDVFFKFFELDWCDSAVSIFRMRKLEDAQFNPELLNFGNLTKPEEGQSNETLETLQTHLELLKKHREKFVEWSERYDCKVSQDSNTPLNYHLNIIDPINPGNNLGKSVSHFNSKRIQRVLAKQRAKLSPLNELKKLIKSGQAETEDIIQYKQSLINSSFLFSKIYDVMGYK